MTHITGVTHMRCVCIHTYTHTYIYIYVHINLDHQYIYIYMCTYKSPPPRRGYPDWNGFMLFMYPSRHVRIYFKLNGDRILLNPLQLICGNKMPTKCNRGLFIAILLLAQHVSGTTMSIIRSSTVLYSGCCLWYFVQHPANRTHNPQLHTRPAAWKPQREIPQAATTV